jgi:hypothetical protein
MAKILDLSTTLRSRFWKLWQDTRQRLEPPEDLDRMSPEKAFYAGYRQGFWQGALAATKVFSRRDQESSPTM